MHAQNATQCLEKKDRATKRFNCVWRISITHMHTSQAPLFLPLNSRSPMWYATSNRPVQCYKMKKNMIRIDQPAAQFSCNIVINTVHVDDPGRLRVKWRQHGVRKLEFEGLGNHVISYKDPVVYSVHTYRKTETCSCTFFIDGLVVQDCSNNIATVLEILQLCIKLSIYDISNIFVPTILCFSSLYL